MQSIHDSLPQTGHDGQYPASMALAGLHSTPVLAHSMLVKAEPPRRAVLAQRRAGATLV